MSVRSEKKQAKLAAILEAAAKVFAAKGFNTATVAEIARQAKVGKGTIYEYVSSKEDLLFEVFSLHSATMIRETRDILAQRQGSAGDRLILLVGSIIDAALLDIELYSLSLEFWSAATAPSLRDRFQDALYDMYAMMRKLVAEQLLFGVEIGEFRPGLPVTSLSHCLVGALDGLMLQAWMDRDLDAKAMAMDFMDCFLRGMQPDAG